MNLPRDRRNSSGIVLIMALVAIAVVMILLVALFAGASHQVRGAQSDGAVVQEKLLADSAVALVIGQIQQASTQPGLAWISQPGLLRTYAATATRAPTSCYKLYSTTSLTNMVDTSGNLSFFATDIPTNWSATPNLYTDINAAAVTLGSSATSIYPIVDPATLTNAANQAAGTQIEGVSSDTGAVTMPVAWLYELQDGTLGPASGGTAANPIVARIAFWTDDDTCKININTAGYGAPWNTPRANSTDDVAWSSNQPAAGEYSSYPGHPAMTSLAPALGTNSYSSNGLTPQQLLGLSPRYAYGGSQFGTVATTPGESVPAKLDRLYASLDELCFSTNTTNGQRMANPINASQLEQARFVLTAHSVAPETTLLGEPRVAIWPVSDTTSASAPQITATDRAIMSDATVGAGTTNVRDYFFQRNNPLSTNDDFNPANTTSIATTNNLQLFGDLVNRGNLSLPGYGASLSAKYPGAEWSQILLEIADYIRCINAVDPSPAPFVPFAGNNANGVGYGFIEPLTTTYGTGTNQVLLRGLGRCPTLSSLTLILYVCGFGFSDGSTIDYETNPDPTGTNWNANFALSNTTNRWSTVTKELVRAFVVPTTFQPGCGYPEVSDNCTIQISGLNGIGITTATANDFGFKSTALSRSLSDALKVTPADRAWGGNEGPLAWRASAIDALQASTFTNSFAGTQPLAVTLSGAAKPSYNSTTKALTWLAHPTMLIHGPVNLTVSILDGNGNPLQTLALSFPSVTVPGPGPILEFTQDGAGNSVMPSYYMTLRNRALLTQANREFLIQPNDTSREIEAGTDLRVIAGLPNVPATMFTNLSTYTTFAQQNSHNLHFADGTAVYGVSGINSPVAMASYPSATTQVSWTNWTNNVTTNYALPISPPSSCPTTPTTSNKGVLMVAGSNLHGDWDTGPGFAPDGAQINLPDSGTTNAPGSAYFSLKGGAVGAPTQRTPNALVPSPVIFGSLPAGINPTTPAQSVPWRTLLFCPYPAADAAHPGFGNASVVPPIVPDHLVLDNFWMPVVEPYAISTCMATSGKINLNDQIAPFTYLHRNTALHALLTDLRIPAIPIANASNYKSSGTPLPTIWNAVDEDSTIAQIENRFANGSANAYLSESEICTVPLVPQGVVAAGASVTSAESTLDAFWQGQGPPDGGLTGDNLRELPYAQLYGRLTTRSNSYTVHVRVQVLQKLAHDPNQNVWNEGVDLVRGEWRGSYEIERYLSPTASAPAAGSALGPYKFRILDARRFAP